MGLVRFTTQTFLRLHSFAWLISWRIKISCADSIGGSQGGMEVRKLAASLKVLCTLYLMGSITQYLFLVTHNVPKVEQGQGSCLACAGRKGEATKSAGGVNYIAGFLSAVFGTLMLVTSMSFFRRKFFQVITFELSSIFWLLLHAFARQ